MFDKISEEFNIFDDSSPAAASDANATEGGKCSSTSSCLGSPEEWGFGKDRLCKSLGGLP